MNRKQRRAAARQRGHGTPSDRGSIELDSRLEDSASHLRAGRLIEAKRLCEAILSQAPNNAEALHRLGVIKGQEGDPGQAIQLIKKAIKARPDDAAAHGSLGNMLRDQGNPKEAIAAYRTVLALEPDTAAAYISLGNVFKAQGKLEDAVTNFQKGLTIKPNFPGALNNLGVVLGDQGKLEKAVTACRKAVALQPAYAEAHNTLGNALKHQGKLEDAMAAYRKAVALQPAYAEARSNLILLMNYDARFTQIDIAIETRRWGEADSGPPENHANTRDPDRRLRVGYVSPDFREHSVSYFVEPLIAGHDRGAVEIFCYAQVVTPDEKTDRFRALADGWCSTVGMSDAAVAQRIRADGIDILVDLAGHTGNNRLAVFAARPAPVQVTWLGYPNTTGLSAMSYRLTDGIADPDGDGEDFYTETLVRLPNGFLCYTPAAEAPEVGDLPMLKNRHVTFGSFNNLAKVTPDVVAVWRRILEQVPESRLLIKSPPLADAETRERYLRMFTARGIDAGRVELRSRTAAKAGHLAAYDGVDIGLDPFPYNGTTTTCEALWMGVPVVTFRGDRHAGRVGASILTRIGLTDLIADTKEAYVESAVRLANDRARLVQYRGDLRQRMQRSPLGDSRAFARDIEAAYRNMWRHWCETPVT